MLYAIVFSMLCLPTLLLTSDKLFDKLNSQGFAEIENRFLLKENYKQVYANFDKFINVMQTNSDFSQKMHT